MVLALTLSGVTCLAIILLVLLKPSVRIWRFNIGTYWLAALLGAVVLLACGCVSPSKLLTEFTSDSAVNPLKILTLFLSMTIISVFLDSVGFFRYFANLALKKAGNSQRKLFLWLYLIVSVLTVFTSNDIIVLTFTPFICYFCKNAEVNPVPYLVTEFVAANTWSMFLIIGNPTNIYLATSLNLDFLTYVKYMFFPSVFAGLAAFGMLWLLFGKQLKKPLSHDMEDFTVKDKPLMIIGLVHLVACIVMLVAASYIGLEMWYVSLGFAVSLFVVVLIYKAVKKQRPVELVHCLGVTPWQLVPFVLSMFVVVLALKECGFTALIADFLGEKFTPLTYGVSSFLAANVINNIPMSVLYSSIIGELGGQTLTAAVYAAIIGSNIGAFLTPLGALAGIMWSGMLNRHEVKFRFIDFTRYGAAIAVPTLFAALGGLYLSLAL